MNDELAQREPSRTATPHGGRFRPHTLELADGGRLALRADGTIERLDALGAVTYAWAPEDAGWADQAIRFGLRPQSATVTPQGHRVQGPKPPG